MNSVKFIIINLTDNSQLHLHLSKIRVQLAQTATCSVEVQITWSNIQLFDPKTRSRMQFRKEKCSPELMFSNVAENIQPGAGNMFSVLRCSYVTEHSENHAARINMITYILRLTVRRLLSMFIFRFHSSATKKTQTIHVGYNFTAILL